MSSVKDASPLGYPPLWQELGLLDDAFLDEQLARFARGQDPHGEHYRYAAFQQLLRVPALSDKRIEQYLQLAALDRDRTMAKSAIVDLIRSPLVSDEQLARLEAQLEADPLFAKQLRRAKESRERA